MSEKEKMPKRREKSRRKRKKFNFMDIIVYICASLLIIGAVYYFISHREPEQEQEKGVAVKNSIKPGQKINPEKHNPKDIVKDKIKEEGNRKQNSIEPKINANKAKEKPSKPVEQDKGKDQENEKEKEKENVTKENIKESEPVKNDDNNVSTESNDSNTTNNNSNESNDCNNTNDNSNESNDTNDSNGSNNSVNDGSGNFNEDVKDKEEDLKSEDDDEVYESASDDNEDKEDHNTDSEHNTDTESDIVLKEEDSDNNDPISVVEESKYPLFDVIKDGNMELFEKAIINIKNFETELNEDGFNALHYAASLMKIDIMKLIIAKKLLPVTAEIKEGEYARNTALHWACLAAENHPEHAIEAVELLLNNGAKLDAPDNNGYTPIFCAIQSGHLELVEYLLAKDGNMIKTIREEDGNTLLHYAMGPCNSRPIMKLLIDKGAEVHAVNGYNREPIHEAAAMGCVDGLRELILTRRISKHLTSPKRNANLYKIEYENICLFGAIPLHFAAFFEQLKAVEFLFLIQSKFDALDEAGKMAIYYSDLSSERAFKNYFHDRRKWEEMQLKLHGEIRSIEHSIRRIDGSTKPSALRLYETYMDNHLHTRI